MRRSVVTAIIIAVGLGLWIVSGQFGGSDPEASLLDADTAARSEQTFTVRARQARAELYVHEVLIRSRTEALRSVELKAETDARVVATPVEKGERVQAGAPICLLDKGGRQADLTQAKALAAQRKLEYDAAVQLVRQGHRSETQTAASKAQFESAQAMVRQMEVELGHTVIRAPFDGLVDDRPAEVGDFLQKGSVCALVVFEDPFLVVGEVSEREVELLEVGGPAYAELASGDGIEGRIRFISSTADEQTRAFRVEVEVPNPDRRLRDGMSAEVRIPVRQALAHYLPPAILVLDDTGQVGVRGVVDETVTFFPITILDDDLKGLWVTGLPETVTLITVGQDFVTEGQKVAVAMDEERAS